MQRVMARKMLRHLNACQKPQFMAAKALKGRQKGRGSDKQQQH